MISIIVFNLLLISIVKCQLPANQTVEQALVATLLNGYNRNIRPSDQVSVSIGVEFKQLIGLDEKNQILTSSLFLKQWWIDGRLQWTPASYNNIEVLMISVKSVWAPDTNVLNSASGDGYLKINSDFSYAAVYYTGEVFFISPVISLQTRCTLNVAKYPFDSQSCSIILASWSFADNKILYSIEDAYINFDDYTTNKIWTLTSSSIMSKASADRDPFESDYNQTAIKINLSITRKPLYYMMNSVFPCFVLNGVTLLTYYMPFRNALGLGTIFARFYKIFNKCFKF